mgnify:CR=1 FL=1
MPSRVNAAVLCAAVVCVVTSPLSAQERPDPSAIGASARAVGLSHAVTAVANDAFSIGINPAGLSHLQQSEAAFVMRAMVARTTAEGTTNSPTSTGFPRYSAGGEVTGTLDAIQFVGGAVPVKVFGRTVAAGFAYRRFDEGLRPGAFKQTRRNTNGRYFNTTTYNTTGGLRAMSPSLAVEVTDRVRLGVTANILSGSSTYTVRTTPIAAGSAPVAQTTRVAERDFSGLAMDMGALVRLREGLQLGVHVTLPHDRPFTRDSANISVPATRAAPMQIAVGAAMQLNAKTALSLDLRHAPWSSVATTVDSSGAAIPSRVGVNDAASIHVGWERDVSDEDKRGTLRLGAFARQTTSVDLNGEAIAAFGASMGKTWFTERGAFEMGLLVSRSTMWTRTSDSITTVSIANTDFALSIGYRKLLGKK